MINVLKLTQEELDKKDFSEFLKKINADYIISEVDFYDIDNIEKLLKNKFYFVDRMLEVQISTKNSFNVDARCISGNLNVEPLGYYFYKKKVRCHN